MSHNVGPFEMLRDRPGLMEFRWDNMTAPFRRFTHKQSLAIANHGLADEKGQIHVPFVVKWGDDPALEVFRETIKGAAPFMPQLFIYE